MILGTERIVDHGVRLCALVIDHDGQVLGVQDKVQLDPSEEAAYTPGTDRHVFQSGPSPSASPSATRLALPRDGALGGPARAQVVFLPHFHEASADSYRPSTFADPANTFHEKALLCRAAENTCYIAAVNCASSGRRRRRRW